MHQYVGKLFSIDLLQELPLILERNRHSFGINQTFKYLFIYKNDGSNNCVFIICYYDERNNSYNNDTYVVSHETLREIDLDKYVINLYSKSNFTWGR